MANGDVVASKTYKVSYKQLANLVSDTSNSFSIASAIITLVAAASGVNIATGAAVVVALISGSSRGKSKPWSKSHGKYRKNPATSGRKCRNCISICDCKCWYILKVQKIEGYI